MADDSASDQDTTPTEDDQAGGLATTVISSTYKVLGAFSASDGAGVLGKNTASQGTPIGVEGAVPNSTDGFGLATPDDTRIDGVIDTNETDFVVEAGTTDISAATNVILGHASNTATSGVVSAVIAGGGYDDGTTSEPNQVRANFGVVGGGRNNTANGVGATVGGGDGNTATGNSATVSGGGDNSAAGGFATVSGGGDNSANNLAATVGGGGFNEASDVLATVAGGGDAPSFAQFLEPNRATREFATVSGGTGNEATGVGATVPGGRKNTASGDYSVAAGRQAATSGYGGTFVVGDSTSSTVAATTSDEVRFQASGGMVVEGGSLDLNGNDVTGVGTATASTVATDTIGPDQTNSVLFSSQMLVRYGGVTRFSVGDTAVNITNGTLTNPSGSLTVTHADGSSNLTLDAGSNTQDLRITNLPVANDDSSEQVLAVDTDDNNRLVLSQTNTLSSQRYKENVAPLDPEPGAVLDLEPRSFEYIESGEEDVGLVAEEVETHIPGLVGYDRDGRPDTLHYDRLGVYLIPEVDRNREAVETNQERIDRLETAIERKDDRIDDLQTENDRLRERNDALEARLAAVESELGLGTDPSPEPADD